MGWVFLLIAGISEIGWPLGLKLASYRAPIFWTAFAVVAMIFSSYFLYLAQRSIPMGIAYSIWTGVGAVGAFLIGIIWFEDPVNLYRVISVALIIIGIIGIKLAG
jgi:quaternary ammonium compound-resistance protein SugE